MTRTGRTSKTLYVCDACGSEQAKWQGQCPDCRAWNTLVEVSTTGADRRRDRGGQTPVKPLRLIEADDSERISTRLAELDRVLGGGLVLGSVVLIGGDPGIGKSTLLLQAAAALAPHLRTLYVTGEESAHQVALRANRLGVDSGELRLLAETCVEEALHQTATLQPRVLIVDSIQTMFSEGLQSAPGAIGQLRESAAQLVRFAKQSDAAVFLVGHVTKEGTLAGPRALEHMVDTVLYFESESGSRYRIIRAVKNRFGAANEIGVFAMTESGLREVRNPSAIFLSRHAEPVPGTAVLVAREGSRPLLVEVQALVAGNHLGNPRRVAIGLEPNRLSLLLAVLHRHGNTPMYDQDVFVNVVGGVQISETAADLAAVLAILSSRRNFPVPSETVVFGEIGLAGEVRPVPFGEERLLEAAKQGYRKAVVPAGNRPKRPIEGLEVVGVSRLGEAIESVMGRGQA